MAQSRGWDCARWAWGSPCWRIGCSCWCNGSSGGSCEEAEVSKIWQLYLLIAYIYLIFILKYFVRFVTKLLLTVPPFFLLSLFGAEKRPSKSAVTSRRRRRLLLLMLLPASARQLISFVSLRRPSVVYLKLRGRKYPLWKKAAACRRPRRSWLLRLNSK